MTTAHSLGLTVPVAGESLSELPGILATAAAAGYTDIWSSEGAQADAFTPLVMAAAVHPEFRVGAAIASVFARSPTLLAMSAAALADIGATRTFVGIGSSSDVMVRDWHGVPFERPYRRVADVLRFMRRALTGEKVSFRADSFEINGFRLARTPSRPPDLLVAALLPRMLALAGREADGVIINLLGPGDVPTAARYVLEQNPDSEIVARIMVIVADDRSSALQIARRQVAPYLNVGVYAEYHRWLGRQDALEPMWRAWAKGDRAGALSAIPESVIDDLFVIGSPDQIAARVQDYVRAGVTTPVLAVTDLTGDQDMAFLGRIRADYGGTR